MQVVVLVDMMVVVDMVPLTPVLTVTLVFIALAVMQHVRVVIIVKLALTDVIPMIKLTV